jgi:uncharacterized membrane protein
LIFHGGFAWNDYWLVLTYALYMLAAACWLPAVAIQMRMKAMLEAQARGAAFDEAACRRLFRWWFMLGWLSAVWSSYSGSWWPSPHGSARPHHRRLW